MTLLKVRSPIGRESSQSLQADDQPAVRSSVSFGGAGEVLEYPIGERWSKRYSRYLALGGAIGQMVGLHACAV